MDPYVLKRLNEARRARQACVLVTDLGDGRDRLVMHDDVVAGPLGDAIGEVLRSARARTSDIDGRAFFLNPQVPEARIVIIGAVHITQALVPMARAAGYGLIIVDPRTAFATLERFADVELHAQWPQDILPDIGLDAHTALAVVTHDPKIDDVALMAAFEAECFYIGALGSRKTHAARRARLAAAGVPDTALDQIAAPIGLDIGAASPGEIAVSILAQIIAARRKPVARDQ